MYVIVHGLVHVVRHAEGGEPRVVDEMEEGDFFGEMALVSRAPRLASVVADTECELLELDRARFEHLAQAHPSVAEVAERIYKTRLLTNLLRASPLFGLLSESARRLLVDAFAVKAHPEGTVLLEMGEPGKGLFVLLRGACGVFHVREDGSEVPYPAMREGDVFGELSLLRDGQVTATVRTLTPCVVLELRRERFDDLLLTDTAVRERIYALAGERYERTRDLIARDTLARRLV
jgi:cAMP-dependent protein kinase regulator